LEINYSFKSGKLELVGGKDEMLSYELKHNGALYTNYLLELVSKSKQFFLKDLLLKYKVIT